MSNVGALLECQVLAGTAILHEGITGMMQLGILECYLLLNRAMAFVS
jgi:hypothetical protein